MSPTTEETRKAEFKRTKLITLIAGLLTAATPGIYGAWESAKTALKARQEEVVRDKQENDLQKNVQALQVAVAALQKSAVTHRDLVDLIVKLKDHQEHQPRRPTPSSTARELELEQKLAELKKQAEMAAKAAKRAAEASKAAPRLKPAKQIRQLVQQANPF